MKIHIKIKRYAVFLDIYCSNAYSGKIDPIFNFPHSGMNKGNPLFVQRLIYNKSLELKKNNL